MRQAWLAVSVLMLSGCAMQVGERNVLRADKPGDAPPSHTLDSTSAPAWQLAELALPVADAELHGVSATRAGNALTVLYFGGNSFHLDQHGAEVLGAIAPCGADVTIFDYRGYGRSKGVPTIAMLKSDALRIFDDVNARRPGQVVLHGQSLGSFVAAYVAQQRPAARGLILESTTTNARDWGNAMLPWYVWPFVRLEISPELQDIDNVAAASGYAGPALVLEGAADHTTPPRLAKQVYAALLSSSKRLLLVPGAGHNDVLTNAMVQPAYCEFIGGLAVH
ncbi:alpha/beta fold hydrolase [Duganella sp. FT134W]|uniref:Alpha/beta fold hydrolase n=1 Tax=Duganella margarita TaxID=2692170 RepID=A0A7X4H482_9BURK|nr:alpha/beta fold hydrolase [Duganella margarita]MYM74491.1 alpha/beta fold hydrolase [Duganella margarita]